MRDGDGIHSLGSARAEWRKTWLWKGKDNLWCLKGKFSCLAVGIAGEGALGVRFVFPSESNSSPKGQLTQKGAQEQAHAHPWGRLGLGAEQVWGMVWMAGGQEEFFREAPPLLCLLFLSAKS